MDQERILRPLDCQDVKNINIILQQHQRCSKGPPVWSLAVWRHLAEERWNRERLMISVRPEEQKRREESDPDRTCWELSDSFALIE